MTFRDISLFRPFNLKADILKEQKIAQEVVYYCESRFRSILLSYNQADDTKKRQWMMKGIQNELESCHLFRFDGLLFSLQGFDLKYIGMAAATGFPLEIPIITRSIIASLFQTEEQEQTPGHLDLNILLVLDAGTTPNDPSSVVSEYKYNWWQGVRAPGPGNILGSGTLQECLDFHRRLIPAIHPVTSYEKHAYMWRELWQAAGEDCALCPQLQAVVIAACEQLQTLRQQVDAFETCYDMERDLGNRRASGFNALFGSAIIKETADRAEPYDAETGVQAPATTLIDVGGSIRKPKKGPEVVERVRAQAARELLEFQRRPNLKWTWGADLDIADLPDMAGAVYNNRQNWSHSGYDTDLADGSVTGMATPPPSPPGEPWKCEALSGDIMDVPALTEDQIPAIFNYYPLARRVAGEDAPELLETLKMQYSRQCRFGRQDIASAPVIARAATPELLIASYTVPTPPRPRTLTKGEGQKQSDNECFPPGAEDDPHFADDLTEDEMKITFPFDRDAYPTAMFEILEE